MQSSKEYTIWNSVTPVAITSSTDATPIVVTATSHGFATGDKVMIQGHTTNVAANGIFKITKVNANSFSLQDINTGADVAGSGAGAGASGVLVPAPKIVLCEDHKSAQLELHTTGSLNATIKALVSLGKKVSDANSHGDTPNFGATQSPSNPWVLAAMVDLSDTSPVDGNTGITSAGTDINKAYEVSINSTKYFTFAITAWSAGVISLKVKLINNS